MCHNDNRVEEAMAKAKYKQLDDGTYYGEIPEYPGVWANERTLEECRRVLQEVLEEWLILKEFENSLEEVEITPEEEEAIAQGIAELDAGLGVKAKDVWKELGLLEDNDQQKKDGD
ncbi:type II toxin-antitoxin system HicB family antitoxin [Desulfallas thermosapovorans]|uniref:Putative RNase H-like HicB family nuclease n=1 Tax=Desulfallas thermosapovorans DSM 6562 TaxID=1121431 RepID=A0A5S4ZR18_9FIRM|nr:type II toxin-antitoxin system HicB family antitoxin [Desulfallas thermosapovorans]TYO94525.1 putative RNase H-like HicB family nuclease [Desulfallas thermosapovorans DSM 6562]